MKILLAEAQHYDMERRELASIRRETSPCASIVDIGAGIGRLALPLAKHSGSVTALDSDEALKTYYSCHKRERVRFVCDKAERYLRSNRFDLYLLAWPPLSRPLIKTIKSSMRDGSKLIVLIPDNSSGYVDITRKIGMVPSVEFKRNDANKLRFFGFLRKEFRVIKSKLLRTNYRFKNDSDAFTELREGLEFWYKTRLSAGQTQYLKMLIGRHKAHTYSELVHFFVLTKRQRKHKKLKLAPLYRGR